MRKLEAFAKNAPMEAETMDRIVDALFSTHPKRSEDPWKPDDLEAPPFTLLELRRAVCSLKNRKAPGPDGLPAEVLKALSEESSGALA